MSRTFAPGKHRVTALKKRMFFTMESPTIKVVGGKRGRGDCVTGEGQDDGGELSLSGEDSVDRAGGTRGTRARCGAGVKHGIDSRRNPVRGRSGAAGGQDGGGGADWDPGGKEGKSCRSRMLYLFSR